jgi:hypothetical protein
MNKLIEGILRKEWQEYPRMTISEVSKGFPLIDG